MAETEETPFEDFDDDPGEAEGRKGRAPTPKEPRRPRDRRPDAERVARDAREAEILAVEIRGTPEEPPISTFELPSKHKVEIRSLRDAPHPNAIDIQIHDKEGKLILDIGRELPTNTIMVGTDNQLAYVPSEHVLYVPTGDPSFSDRFTTLLPTIFHEIQLARTQDTPPAIAIGEAEREALIAQDAASDDPTNPELNAAAREARLQFRDKSRTFEIDIWAEVAERSRRIREEKKFDIFEAYPDRKKFVRALERDADSYLTAPLSESSVDAFDERALFEDFFDQREKGYGKMNFWALQKKELVSGAKGIGKFGLGLLIAGAFRLKDLAFWMYEGFWKWFGIEVDLEGKKTPTNTKK